MEQRNVILAFALSMLILLGWGMLFPPVEQTEQVEASKATTQESVSAEGDSSVPELRPADLDEVPTLKDVAVTTPSVPAKTLKTEAITGKTITIGNDLLKLDINQRGWIVAARLTQYKETLETGSPLVSVLGEDE
ncbi:MAG TPA: membrane protein insertase YidC, partial [Anaerolineales bacterium]|nr:membrane protein insertase YidC [Anaerolineales bacterium]